MSWTKEITDIAFRQELEELINRHSREAGSNTPDFILVEYLTTCLAAFDTATIMRDQWYAPRKFPDGQRVVVASGHYKVGAHGTVVTRVGNEYRLKLDEEPSPVYLFMEEQLVAES